VGREIESRRDKGFFKKIIEKLIKKDPNEYLLVAEDHDEELVPPVVEEVLLPHLVGPAAGDEGRRDGHDCQNLEKFHFFGWKKMSPHALGAGSRLGALLKCCSLYQPLKNNKVLINNESTPNRVTSLKICIHRFLPTV
jgi:hypothetical protein